MSNRTRYLIVGMVTFFFGVFGAIPASIMADNARKVGGNSKGPWKVFVGMIALQLAIGLIGLGLFYKGVDDQKKAATQAATIGEIIANAPKSISQTDPSSRRFSLSRVEQSSPNTAIIYYSDDASRQEVEAICINPPTASCGIDAGGVGRTWNGVKITSGAADSARVAMGPGGLSTFVAALG